MATLVCPVCGGTRYKPEPLAVRIGGKNIAEVSDMPINAASEFFNSLELTEKQRIIADRVLKELHARLNFLINVGLSYLTLSRAAGTLSGGEAQRIRLATQIGSGLTGVLYILDERASACTSAITTSCSPRSKTAIVGNTPIVVVHDEDTKERRFTDRYGGAPACSAARRIGRDACGDHGRSGLHHGAVSFGR
jgi:excinuclease ABC subunit A